MPREAFQFVFVTRVLRSRYGPWYRIYPTNDGSSYRYRRQLPCVVHLCSVRASIPVISYFEGGFPCDADDVGVIGVLGVGSD